MSRWIEWIKEFAKKTNKSYGCALSDPECSASYRRKYGVAKKVPAKVEREKMGMEDKDAPAPPLPPPPIIVEPEVVKPVDTSGKKTKKVKTPIPTSTTEFPKIVLNPDEKRVLDLYKQIDSLRGIDIDAEYGLTNKTTRAEREEALKKHYARIAAIQKKLFNNYGIIPEDTDYYGRAIFRRNPKISILDKLQRFAVNHSLDYIKNKYETLKLKASYFPELPHLSLELKRIKNIIDEAEKYGTATGKSVNAFFIKKYGPNYREESPYVIPIE